MYLTKEEEQIYEGERGWTLQKAMQILVAIGELNGAERLIPIKSAHVSGASTRQSAMHTSLLSVFKAGLR